MKRIVLGLALLGLVIPPPELDAGAPPNADFDLTIAGVELRPGVLVDIHVKVFVNEAVPCRGRTFFAVHGIAHTAATWEPLVEELFEDNPTGAVVCRVAAIDLPGRDGSGLPSNLAYGDLVLADHVTAVLGTLEALRQEGIRPHVIVGHSQGSLLVQMTQQRLLDDGTDLRRHFQIHGAVLLAPVAPIEIPWLFVDSGAAGALLAQFLTFDPVLGLIIDIPDAAFPALFFSDLRGVLASGAPPPAQVTALGYNAPEPLLATLNLVGEPPFARPSVGLGAFAPRRGTKLYIATYEQDMLIRPAESTLLYEHLTGDRALDRLVVVTGPGTVHDLHLADPEGLLRAVAGTVRF